MSEEHDSCLDATKLTEGEYDLIYKHLLKGLGSPVLARWVMSVVDKAVSDVERQWKGEIAKLVHARYQDSVQSSQNMLSAALAGVTVGSRDKEDGS